MQTPQYNTNHMNVNYPVDMNNAQTISAEGLINDFQNNGNYGPNNGGQYVQGAQFNALAPNQQQQINQGIVAGFGQFFFNAHDPNISKTNVPIKKESSKHVPIIMVTLLYIAGIIVGIILLPKTDTKNAGIGVMAGSFVLYILISIFCSDIRGYISNLKKFDDYKETFDKMTKGRGFFHFWIECYHYKTIHTKNGGTRRQKVVTHRAQQNYYPVQSIDESGNITGIKDITKYVFINYLKRFYFTDPSSETAYQKAYDDFIYRNRKDQFQNYSSTFQIEGFEPEVGFCMLGKSPHNTAIFYILTLLGLNLPYACILERSVSRYEINILKRLTCR